MNASVARVPVSRPTKSFMRMQRSFVYSERFLPVLSNSPLSGILQRLIESLFKRLPFVPSFVVERWFCCFTIERFEGILLSISYNEEQLEVVFPFYFKYIACKNRFERRGVCEKKKKKDLTWMKIQRLSFRSTIQWNENFKSVPSALTPFRGIVFLREIQASKDRQRVHYLQRRDADRRDALRREITFRASARPRINEATWSREKLTTPEIRIVRLRRSETEQLICRLEIIIDAARVPCSQELFN